MLANIIEDFKYLFKYIIGTEMLVLPKTSNITTYI